MKKHQIQIAVSIDQRGNANFTYDPGVQRVYGGDMVRWICNDGPVAILFKEATPCNKMDARSVCGEQPFESEALEVTNKAAPGHYHYAVAAYVDGKVYLDAACPELIVN
jgi:hypothetical protein